MNILHNLKHVGLKREMKSIWTDMLEEDIGPKREKKSIWHDRQEEAVGFLPCFDDYYENTTELITSNIDVPKRVLKLGAGTGLLTYY